MNPDSRPISLTSPTPLRALVASLCAAQVARRASETAVSKPNDVCTNEMSLSIVLGIPITADLQPAASHLVGDRRRAAQRAVAADGEENADSQPIEGIDHFSDVLRPAGRSQDRAAHFVDVGDVLRREFQRDVAGLSREALEAEAKTVDIADSVMMVQPQNDGPHDVVEPRTQAAAGDDPAAQVTQVEEDLFAGAGHLEIRRFSAAGRNFLDLTPVAVVQHGLVVAHEANVLHRRRGFTLSQPVHLEIQLQLVHRSQRSCAMQPRRCRPFAPIPVVSIAPSRPSTFLRVQQRLCLVQRGEMFLVDRRVGEFHLRHRVVHCRRNGEPCKPLPVGRESRARGPTSCWYAPGTAW